MGVFITVRLDPDLCAPDCAVCVETCPVKIFINQDKKVTIDSSNEDECTLCDMCLERCPAEAIELIKNY